MNGSTSKSIRVAAVQMECLPGEVDANLEHAEKLVAEAVKQGAKLVLLPELMPGGYMVTEEAWEHAATMDGKPVQWLKALSWVHGIYLGFSFLEADGDDFYNTFVLANPQGEIDGRVRKAPAASIEAHFYREGNDPHVIETAIGRVGVSICYENLLFERINELAGLDVDLVLSPSAAGRPKPILPGDVQRFEMMLKRMRALYADVLGVPNVLANRTGPLETELPGMLPDLKSSFPGLSAITDGDGTLLAGLGDQEGVIVADVALNPARKKREAPKCVGKRWAFAVPWYAFIWPMTQRTGEKAYRHNPRRIVKAHAISRAAKGGS